MNNDETQQKADFKAVKEDAKKLASDVSSWVATASADTKQKWEETRPVLEEKLATAQAHAERIGTASAGAANEMGKGFMGAFTELKKAFTEARKHFQKPAANSEEKTEDR